MDYMINSSWRGNYLKYFSEEDFQLLVDSSSLVLNQSNAWRLLLKAFKCRRLLVIKLLLSCGVLKGPNGDVCLENPVSGSRNMLTFLSEEEPSEICVQNPAGRDKVNKSDKSNESDDSDKSDDSDDSDDSDESDIETQLSKMTRHNGDITRVMLILLEAALDSGDNKTIRYITTFYKTNQKDIQPKTPIIWGEIKPGLMRASSDSDLYQIGETLLDMMKKSASLYEGSLRSISVADVMHLMQQTVASYDGRLRKYGDPSSSQSAMLEFIKRICNELFTQEGVFRHLIHNNSHPSKDTTIDACQLTIRGQSVLHHAIQLHDQSLIKTLIQQYPPLLETLNKAGESPLFIGTHFFLLVCLAANVKQWCMLIDC